MYIRLENSLRKHSDDKTDRTEAEKTDADTGQRFQKGETDMAHLFVIAGHGAGDPGASGNGYTEAERVRVLAAKLKAYGGDDVTVGDTDRDWYADNGISSLDISKDWQIVELHMDSASVSARGGHVIINAGYEPDKYDNALAEFISGILPGRAQTIVKRSDLANPKRAAAKGYPYRLLECGFISNAEDLKIFNSRTDEIAKGIIKAFGIKASASQTAGDTVSKPVSGSVSSGSSKAEQLKADGYWGTKTTRRLQQIFNTQEDGKVSNQFSAYKSQNPGLDSGWEWKSSPSGYSPLIKAIQKKTGAAQDGHIGPRTIKAVQKWMGAAQDGRFDAPSPCIKKLQQWINKQK